MALTVSFTASSVAGSPGSVLFADTSSGSDGAVTTRRLYISDETGAFIVPTGISTQYSVWALPLSTTLTLSLFSEASAVKIVAQWLNVSGTVLYDYTIAASGFTQYLEEFLYGKVQLMSQNPLLINDNNFWKNYSKVRTLTDAGNQALLQASDLYNAQQCYEAATEIMDNAQYLFNANS